MEIDLIQDNIFEIRGCRVMLDRDLAGMYGVETRTLNQAVKRNIVRFPTDFIFQLSDEEVEIWISQIVISNSIKMGVRKNPFAFTEPGVSMLSSVLNSKTAIQINMGIMRVFVAIRQMVLNPSVEPLSVRINTIEEYLEGILTNQNEINEDTRMQLELINESLASNPNG